MENAWICSYWLAPMRFGPMFCCAASPCQEFPNVKIFVAVEYAILSYRKRTKIINGKGFQWHSLFKYVWTFLSSIKWSTVTFGKEASIFGTDCTVNSGILSDIPRNNVFKKCRSNFATKLSRVSFSSEIKVLHLSIWILIQASYSWKFVELEWISFAKINLFQRFTSQNLAHCCHINQRCLKYI